MRPKSLSEDFILSHITTIDIPGLVRTGDFIFTPRLLDALFDESNILNPQYIVQNTFIEPIRNNVSAKRGTLTNPVIFVFENKRAVIPQETMFYFLRSKYCSRDIVTNKAFMNRFTMSVDTIKKLEEIDPSIKSGFYVIPFSRRRILVDAILHNAEVVGKLGMKYIKTLYQGGESMTTEVEYDEHGIPARKGAAAGIKNIPNMPYLFDFSVDMIKENIDKWNQEVNDVFIHMTRTPDTNYHYYLRSTGWDSLSVQETILLTYDICKYLNGIEVLTGGSYTLEDGHHHTDDEPNHPINGLRLMSKREIRDDEEFRKILDDFDLMKSYFSFVSPFYKSFISNPVVDRFILDFFEKNSFELFEKMIKEKYGNF